MSKDNVPAWDTTATNNSDITGVDISGATGKVKDGDNGLRAIMAGIAAFTRRGADTATAATLNLDGTPNEFLDLTGTTTVTAVTLTDKHNRRARAQGVFQLTASATLIVNGSTSTNYTTAAGDLLFFEGYSASTVRVWTMPSVATSSSNGTVGLTQLGLAYNVGIASSVGSSALTVSLKGADGNDPSASNPVVIPFRNATLTTGTPVMRTSTAATSIVVASTKTLGTSSGVAFRLWVLAVDTGSGIELGLVNCLSGTSIMALSSSDLYSPTATPGNSAQVIYTTSGQTSKPICVLGYLDFSSGEATAGTWATAADRIQVRNLGTKLPGDRVQLQRTDTGAVATGTTVVPIDDTIPQNTEGDQYMTQAITPSCAANILRATASGTYSNSGAANGNFVQALFRDSTASALAAANFILPASTGPGLFLTDKSVLAASTSTTTFKVRAGYQVAGTTTFNGSSAARQFGGVYNSFIQVEEIMA